MLENFKAKLNKKQEIYLKIKVHPGSGKIQIKEIMDNGTIKVGLTAPPVKGKANQGLVKFLAKEFAVSKNNVKIVSGIKEKIKLIRIASS